MVFTLLKYQPTEDEQKQMADEYLSGKSIASIAYKYFGSLRGWQEWILTNADAWANFMNARQLKIEMDVDSMDEIASDDEIDVARARLRTDITKWKASKLIPHVYGDRVSIDVNQTVDIRAALELAESRATKVIEHSEIKDLD